MAVYVTIKEDELADLRTQLEEARRELERLKERENQFWEMVRNSFEIETREELEEEAKGWENRNAMECAVHAMWKRDPKIEALLNDPEWVMVRRDRLDSFLGVNSHLRIPEHIEGFHAITKKATGEDVLVYLATPPEEGEKEGDSECR